MFRTSVLALLLIAGCTQFPVEEPAVGPPVPSPEQDSCGAGPYASLVGQDATALERVLIMRQIRVIRPGQAITMDYRPERINFEIGQDGTIARITCG